MRLFLFRNPLIVACLGVVLLLLAYSPLFVNHFLFSDDWYWYALLRVPQINIKQEAWGMALADGRFLHGLVFSHWAQVCMNLISAWWGRIGAVFIVILLFVALYDFIRRHLTTCLLEAMIGSLGVCLLPGIAISVLWLVSTPSLLALLWAVLAAHAALYAQQIKLNAVVFWPRLMLWSIAAILLQIAAFLSYQPFALLYFSCVGIAVYVAWLKSLEPVKNLIKHHFYPVFLGIVALVIYFVIYMATLRILGVQASSRSQVHADQIYKFLAILPRTWIYAAQLWLIDIHFYIAGSLSLIGLCFYLKQEYAQAQKSQLKYWVMWLVVLIMLLSIPFFFERPLRFRKVVPISAVLWLGFVVMLKRFTWYRPAALLIFGFCAPLLTAHNLNDYVLKPAQKEIAFITSVLQQELLPTTQRIVVIRASRQAGILCKRISEDEYGMPSSYQTFSIHGMVQFALNALHIDKPIQIIHQSLEESKEIPTTSKQQLVIDMNRIAQE